MPVGSDGALMTALETAFPGVDPLALEALGRRGSVTAYPEDAMLCHQGEHEDAFAVLIDGQADVYMDQPSGRSFIAYLGGGETLGGLEYITGTPRIADVVVSRPVTALQMSFDDLDEVVEEHPAILKELAREVITEITTSQQRFMQLSAVGAEQMHEVEVFISYARADVDFAKHLTSGLRREDIAVWLDVFSITAGKSWNRQVGDALDRCSLMVLVISPRSMDSENSDDEWNYFLDKNKKVIPVLFESADIRYRLNKLQYIDFAAQPFDTALDQLVLAIKRAVAEGLQNTEETDATG